MKMKRTAAMLLVAALLITASVGLSGCSSDQSTDNAATKSLSKAFSTMDTKDINGKKVTSDIFADKKVTMVSVWATWCGVCVSEMPDIEKLSQYYSKGDEVGVVGLVTQADRASGVMLTGLTKKEKAKALKIIKDSGATYTQLTVSSDMSSALSDIQSFPTTYFLNSKGEVIGSPVIGRNDIGEWKAIIQEKLNAV